MFLGATRKDERSGARLTPRPAPRATPRQNASPVQDSLRSFAHQNWLPPAASTRRVAFLLRGGAFFLAHALTRCPRGRGPAMSISPMLFG